MGEYKKSIPFQSLGISSGLKSRVSLMEAYLPSISPTQMIVIRLKLC